MNALIATLDGQIGTISSTSGAFEPLTTNRINDITDIAVSSDESIFATTFDTLYTVDKTTKEFVKIGEFGSGVSINAIGFSDDDELFGIATGSSEVYSINTATGTASAVFDIGSSFNSSGDLEFSALTGEFFATSTSPVSDTLYSFKLESQTGEPSQSTEVGAIGFDGVWGLSSSQDGLIGYTRDREEISIDPLTGAGRLRRTVTGLSSEITGAANFSRTEAPDPENPTPNQLAVSISSPRSITADGTDEVTVTYRNTGEVDIAAPLLSLSVEGGQLRLGDSAEFDENQIQFLAINNEGTAGILPPGASNSFTVEFMPEANRTSSIDFSVGVVDGSERVNWEALRSQSKPDYIPDDAWQQIYDNFVAQVGTTTDDYRQLLTENANYLSQLGQYTADASTLLAFEFQQASDFQALSQQYSSGSLGTGQPFIGDLQLTTEADGDVAIDSGGTRRSFSLRDDGTYQGLVGDRAILSLDNSTGVYTLQEPDGTQVVFNSAGQLNYIEDTNGTRLTAAYTNQSVPNQLTKLSDDFGNETTFDYNSLGVITSITTPDGQTTAYTYDESGSTLETITDAAGTTTYTYSGAELTSITDPSGVRLELAYDDQGRVSQERLTGDSGVSQTVTYRYDSAGGVTVVDESGNETTLLLNENGQVGQLTDANGQQVRYRYDTQGNLIQIVRPENNTSLFGYDAQRNLTTQVNPLGEIIQFAYEPTFNQLTSVTDARGNDIAYRYDPSGNLTAIEYADGSQETFEYSDRGQITTATNRSGQQITYAYSSEGELISQQTPDSVDPTTYTYDENDYLDTVVDQTGTTDLDYDAAGRLVKITYPNGRSLSYLYDASDRRTSMTDQDGNVTNYAYDAIGRLSSLTDGADELIVNYQYDAVGRLAREDKGNSTYTLYDYDSAGQLLSIVNHAPDDSINSSAVYTYDSLGRQSSQTTLEGQWSYEYDAAGQLIGAEFASSTPDIANQSLAYEYDAAGNRIRTVENGTTTDYKTNNLNQYTEVGGFEYEYDADGNLVSKTDATGTFLYGYDSENRLTKVIEPGGEITVYEYNAFGDRIASIREGERTEYLIDPFGYGDVVAEYDTDGNLASRYTHGLGLETLTTGANNHYYDFNAIGSTTSLTDDSGKVANSYFYSPFGKDIVETETVSNPFEFVGQYGVTEEVHGLDFMRARFYESDNGRFVAQDPIGINGGVNLYRYVSNSPLSGVDPEGTNSILILSGGVLAVYGALKLFEAFGDLADGTQQEIKDLNNFIERPSNRNADQLINSNREKYRKAGDVLEAGSNVSINRVNPIKNPNIFSGVEIFGGLVNIFSRSNPSEDLDIDVPPIRSQKIAESSTTISGNNTSNSTPSTPKNQARSKGEPHLTTFDGIGYDFQGAGDFTLVESKDDDLNIQVRYVQIDDNVTVASAVATEVDGQTVVIDSEGIEFVPDDNNPDVLIPRVNRRTSGREATITVDGQVVEVASGGSVDIGNSRLYRSRGSEYTLVYAGEDGIISDGDDQLVVNYFRPGTINTVDVYLGDEHKDEITGLLGNLNDNPNDDIALRDGTLLARPLSFDQLYGRYSNDYRIKSIDDSLFNYAPGQSPDTFYNPNFPAAPFTFDDLDPEARARGEAAAIAAGYTPGTFAFESAAFDFAVTGEIGFLEGADNALDAEEVSVVVGGEDTRTSSIQGTVFQDLNGNGIRDSELVQGENPDVVFVVDVSDSTRDSFQGTPVGDVNGDGQENTILDAELAGFVALNQQLIDQGLGDRVDIGLVLFGLNGTQVDLQPAEADKPLSATPSSDTDNNGIPDIEDALRRVTIGGNGAGRSSTNFKAALDAANKTFEEFKTAPGEGNLIFLSDGEDAGNNTQDELQQLTDKGVNLSAFGVGSSASLSDLQSIDPDASQFTSTDELLGVFLDLEGGESQSVLEPVADGITVYIDANNNSVLDTNELTQVTDQLGQYTFTELIAGDYTVREILPEGFTQTAPSSGSHKIRLGADDTRTELNFGHTSVDVPTINLDQLLPSKP